MVSELNNTIQIDLFGKAENQIENLSKRKD